MDTAKFDLYDNQSYLRFSNPSVIEKDLQTLAGIIEGIKSDNQITEKEHLVLLDWVNRHKIYEEKQPYKEVISIIRDSLGDNVLSHDECANIKWFCDQYIKKTGYFNVITSGIQKLTGLVKGISMDKEISLEELTYLDAWLEENDYLRNAYPYDELYNLTTRIIQDKVINAEEHEALLSFCNAISGNPESESNDEIIGALKTGFYQIDPVINIQENTFCLTGNSKKYKRREIAERIELYGGIVTDRVSSKLNYLVVCDEKNVCWAFTCYGRKIEEAIKHRKQGIPLAIVHEFDLYDTLESL